MGRWREFWRSLRGWQRATLAVIGIALFLFIFFVVSYETVHYTESTQFCSTCHSVMEPEIVTHSVSAHAHVDCGDCHVGPGIGYKIYYKVSALRYLYTLPLHLYDRPLDSPRETMRSTEEICEQCHTPENFQAVEVRTNNEYALDEQNSFQRLLLALKVGNGEDRVAGRGLGAHWHVANPVYFIATDTLRQDIPWVQVEKNGELVTYVDSGADPALWADAEANKKTMDCIDCHSRDGHMVHKPEEVLDNAITNNLIPADLPYVKAQSLAALERRYETREEGLDAIATVLQDFYQTRYPDLYVERQTDIERTVAQVQTIFQQTHFPYMNVYWNTYPDHVGHEDFPGCWRCHDSSHLNDQGEAIPADCNLCHGIPEKGAPGERLTAVSLAQEEMPESHQQSLWISEHRFRFDATCDDCHTVSDPGGTSNTSFCSNSGCHASEWTFLNIDAPAVLAQVVPEQTPSERRLPRIPHPIVEAMDCQQCHGPEKVFAYPEDHIEYSQDECTDCHSLSEEVLADIGPTPTPPPAEATAAPAATAIPMINHTLLGNENCLACHAVNSNIVPAPVTHQGFTNDICQRCHLLAPEFATLPTVTETLAPIGTPQPSPTTTLTLTVTVEASPTLSAQTPPAEPTRTDANATDANATDANATSVSPQGSAILHPIEGNENCLACHAVNSAVAPAPPNHAGFTADLCQSCHPPAPAATGTPEPMPTETAPTETAPP